VTPQRARVLHQVADLVPRTGRIGVDGVDGAGKTTFADELAAELRRKRSDVVRVRLDDFLNPAAVRHRRGRRSPSGYWADSFDYDRLRAALPSSGLAVVDGVFLQRPELADEFGYVVFLEVGFAEAARRMALRDGSPVDPDHPQMRRYTVAQRRYLTDHAPRERADLVIDNNDVDNPLVIRTGSRS
jgi:uridine kinase